MAVIEILSFFQGGIRYKRTADVVYLSTKQRKRDSVCPIQRQANRSIHDGKEYRYEG